MSAISSIIELIPKEKEQSAYNMPKNKMQSHNWKKRTNIPLTRKTMFETTSIIIRSIE